MSNLGIEASNEYQVKVWANLSQVLMTFGVVHAAELSVHPAVEWEH